MGIFGAGEAHPPRARLNHRLLADYAKIRKISTGAAATLSPAL